MFSVFCLCGRIHHNSAMTMRFCRSVLLGIYSAMTIRAQFVVNPSILGRLREIEICFTKPTKQGLRASRLRAIPTVNSRSVFTRPSADHGCSPNNNVAVKRVPRWKLGSYMNLGLFDARFVWNKCMLLCEQIMDFWLHILGIIEAWLKDGVDSVTLDLCPPGFMFVGRNRPKSMYIGPAPEVWVLYWRILCLVRLFKCVPPKLLSQLP